MLESKRLPREFSIHSGLEKKMGETFNLWSPPALVWSRWHKVQTLTIPATVKITAEPVLIRSSNEFHIQVRYIDENSVRQFDDFSVLRKITFKAGSPSRSRPDAQVIAVRLRSSTTGQNIRVRVDWQPR